MAEPEEPNSSRMFSLTYRLDEPVGAPATYTIDEPCATPPSSHNDVFLLR